MAVPSIPPPDDLQLLVLQELRSTDHPIRSRELRARLEASGHITSQATLMRSLAPLVASGWVEKVRVDRDGRMILGRGPENRAPSTAYRITASAPTSSATSSPVAPHIQQVREHIGRLLDYARIGVSLPPPPGDTAWLAQLRDRLRRAAGYTSSSGADRPTAHPLAVPAGDGEDEPAITLLEPIGSKCEWPFFFAFRVDGADAAADRYRLIVTGDSSIQIEAREGTADRWAPVQSGTIGDRRCVVFRSDRFDVAKADFPKRFTWAVEMLSPEGVVLGRSDAASAELRSSDTLFGMSSAYELFRALGVAHEEEGQYERAVECYAAIPDPDVRLAVMVEMYQRRCRVLSDRLDAADDLGLDGDERDRLQFDLKALNRLLIEYRRQVAERLAQLGE